MLYSSLGRADKMDQLVDMAVKGMKNNVAFLSAFLAGSTDKVRDDDDHNDDV